MAFYKGGGIDMDKLEKLEKQINKLLEDNYKDEYIEADLKNGVGYLSIRKGAFEHVLEMINEIKSEN